jgi:hypothetical protein
MKLDDMDWTCGMNERHAYNSLVETPVGEKCFKRSRIKWKNNIKMYLKK